MSSRTYTSVLVLVVAMATTLCRGQSNPGHDATLLSGTSGADVVDAVVGRIRSRCIFPEDRLFLRRLAYVMSRDGIASMTYRAGFHGGIWQVSAGMLEATKACDSNVAMQAACDTITSAFAIHWPAVAWSDLRKPLYSGLAAALSTLLTLDTAVMPGSVSDQAAIWRRMYGARAMGAAFQDSARLTDTATCSAALDLAFLLDSSGSISYTDFQLMLRFAADVIDGMDISADAVRVAHLTYSSDVTVHYDFNAYSTKAQARSLMVNTDKIEGSTNTAEGLQTVTSTLYDAAAGARSNAKKVTVLVTDGASDSFSHTSDAARALRDLGTTVFAVGVGNYNLEELHAVASDPVCAHVMTLSGFDHIQAILSDIKKSACQANERLTDDQTIEGTLSEGQFNKTATTQVQETNKIIKATVSCGILDVYVSTSDTKPSSAVYEERYRASHGRPAYLTLVETLATGTPVYISVVGTRLPPTAAAARNCSDYKWSMGWTEANERTTDIMVEDSTANERTTDIMVEDSTTHVPDTNVAAVWGLLREIERFGDRVSRIVADSLSPEGSVDEGYVG